MRTSIDLARVLSKFGRDGSGYHGDMLFALDGASVVVEHVRIWRHCWRTRKQSCFGNCISGRASDNQRGRHALRGRPAGSPPYLPGGSDDRRRNQPLVPVAEKRRLEREKRVSFPKQRGGRLVQHRRTHEVLPEDLQPMRIILQCDTSISVCGRLAWPSRIRS